MGQEENADDQHFLTIFSSLSKNIGSFVSLSNGQSADAFSLEETRI